MSRVELKIISQYLKENDYKKHEVKAVLKKLKNMDPDILNALIAWCKDGVADNLEIEEISVYELHEKMGFSYVNAYLYLDWLKREPQEAKIALAGVIDKVRISELSEAQLVQEFGDEIEENLEANNDESYDKIIVDDDDKISDNKGGLNG